MLTRFDGKENARRGYYVPERAMAVLKAGITSNSSRYQTLRTQWKAPGYFWQATAGNKYF